MKKQYVAPEMEITLFEDKVSLFITTSNGSMSFDHSSDLLPNESVWEEPVMEVPVVEAPFVTEPDPTEAPSIDTGMMDMGMMVIPMPEVEPLDPIEESDPITDLLGEEF